MKLQNYTTSYFAGVLLVLLSIWAVIFYLEMLDEIYDSLDDGLENQKMLVIQRAKEQTDILNKPEFDDGSYTIKKVSPNYGLQFKDTYRDTLMYMQNEDDFEPVRMLESVFKLDNSYYKIKIVTSMVEEDDLIEDLLFSLIMLYLGLIVSILLLNNFILKKIWNPFYLLLNQLKDFRIDKDKTITTSPSKIDEFNLLNKRIEQMLGKSVESYNSQKQFIENAAHELQTPLAISINKLELLVENNNLTEDQIAMIASALNNLEGLTRMNKSLLLLSKIENSQYDDDETVNLAEISKELIEDFQDLATHKGMKINFVEAGSLNISMNRQLARVLISNLFKNAIIHGAEENTIEVKVSNDKFSVSNAGRTEALNPDKIFSRFQSIRTSKRSNGIGLAISKAITERYNLNLNYEFTGRHNFYITR
ncbi:Signal transduction histidine kinase [Salegentibacter echinorum]|uniref:histidine kinase n=1 Tax=Salegentibacter echinorum TaxID=1073325 RepID=A0A1M5M2H3_SALEC|nr:HAMP domain-containing sensor histidine kinase [Salegentibacter echinorum]SHG71497.1 Signal transduction histidine kinase [Salegentibacter echinorum]